MYTPYPNPQPAGYRQRGPRKRHRIAWAAVPVWSAGILAFVPFLRLALTRRRPADWWISAAYFSASAGLIAAVQVTATDRTASGVVGGLAILIMGVAAVHAYVAFGSLAELAWQPDLPPGAHPNQLAVQTARARMQLREESRKLAQANPVLGRELRIGRPDLPRQYDDGGLIAVNQVPMQVLASQLGLTPQESQSWATARAQLGRFGSAEELSIYAQLPPDRIDILRDQLWFD